MNCLWPFVIDCIYVVICMWWLAAATSGGGSVGGIEYEQHEFEFDKPTSPTLVMCMSLLDEESNLRLNLPLWKDVVDAYVFGIDDRTEDNTVKAIVALLPSSVPREVVYFQFDDGGFSSARNIVLRTAWAKFSWVSHIIMADPDWRPKLNTVDKSQLDHAVHKSFEFKVWDRSGTTRTET